MTGGGTNVVAGGAVVVVAGADFVLDGRTVVAVAVEVVSVVGVPHAPLYWYWPCHDVHDGLRRAGGNGTSGRLPIAVSM